MPSPPQLVPDPAGGLYGSAVSLATPPTLSLSFPSRVATARGSHARTAAISSPTCFRPHSGHKMVSILLTESHST